MQGDEGLREYGRVLSVSWSVSSVIVSYLRPEQELRALAAGLSIALVGSIVAAFTVADGYLSVYGIAMAVIGFGIGMTTTPIVQRATRIAPKQERPWRVRRSMRCAMSGSRSPPRVGSW